jgi:hypothetical protein
MACTVKERKDFIKPSSGKAGGHLNAMNNYLIFSSIVFLLVGFLYTLPWGDR